MKVTIISASEWGGAANAAKNLQQGFINEDVDVGFISEEKVIAERKGIFAKLNNWWHVRKHIKRNAAYLNNSPHGYDHFSFARTGYHNVHKHPLVKSANVLNLHWISYLIDYPSFFKKIGKPVIWTLHDTNLFTGGCHYTFGCEKYRTDCAGCPQLAPEVTARAAKDNLKLKQESISHIGPDKMVVISPSLWLKTMSEQSTLFKRYQHYHIPYGIDTATFKWQDQQQSRQLINLPVNKFIVLFVGTSLAEHRKGFDIILKLQKSLKLYPDIMFVAIGKTDEVYDGIDSIGYISDRSTMATAYNAADVFIIPSRQDNLPNTMLEALCCGTPVIGYKTGGIIDAVEHDVNGFLADKEDIANIATQIIDMANGRSVYNRKQIADLAGKKYSLEKQANAYLNIINKLTQ